MPGFAILEGKEAVKEAARRVFDLGKKPDPALVDRSRRALVRMNPHLEHPGELGKGTIVIVPDDHPASADVRPASEASVRKMQQLLELVEQARGLYASEETSGRLPDAVAARFAQLYEDLRELARVLP